MRQFYSIGDTGLEIHHVAQTGLELVSSSSLALLSAGVADVSLSYNT